jgi:hypothetical protein
VQTIRLNAGPCQTSQRRKTEDSHRYSDVGVNHSQIRQFHSLEGEPIMDADGRKRQRADLHSCPTCSTTVFWENEGFPGQVTVWQLRGSNIPPTTIAGDTPPVGLLAARHTAKARSQARVMPNCYCSPNRGHFGREARSTRCSGVRPKTACSLVTRWLSFSRRPLRLPQLPRAILKVPTASCRVVTLGSRSSAEAAQRSAPMSFSRANAGASSAPSYISHAIFLIHRPPARLPT